MMTKVQNTSPAMQSSYFMELSVQFNGIDLDGLAHEAEKLSLPDVVPGRVVHIDADFLAYQVSYEKLDDPKTFEDMQHNAEVAVEFLKNLAGATNVHLHLTPGTSDKGGRYDIALLKEYQGNRQDKPKPRYLHIMREWLGKHFPGTLHQMCEADDGMASAQYLAISSGKPELSIIASKDKDLRMVPGLHLDWDTGVITNADTFGEVYLDETKSQPKIGGYGQKFFWAQMLTGDAADSISGLPKVPGSVMNKIKPRAADVHSLEVIANKDGKYTVGEITRAQKHLEGRSPAACGPATAIRILDKLNSNKDCFNAVKALYKMYGETIGFINWRDQSPVSWQQAFISEAKLLWMRRNKHDPNCVVNWWKEITA